MWISKKRYEKLLQNLQDSEMDAKYWKESYEETYEKYLNCLSYKYGNNNRTKEETQKGSYYDST